MSFVSRYASGNVIRENGYMAITDAIDRREWEGKLVNIILKSQRDEQNMTQPEKLIPDAAVAAAAWSSFPPPLATRVQTMAASFRCSAAAASA